MVKFLKDVLVQYFSVHLRHIHCTEIKNNAPHTNFYLQVAGKSYYLQLINEDLIYDPELLTNFYQFTFFKLQDLNSEHLPLRIVKNKLGYPITKFKDQFWRLFEVSEFLIPITRVLNSDQANKIGKLLGQLHANTHTIDVTAFKNNLPQPFYANHIIADFEFALQVTEDANIEEAHDVIVYLQDRIAQVLYTYNTAKELFPLHLIHGNATIQNILVNNQDHLVTLYNWDKMCVGHYLYDYSYMLKSVAALQDMDCVLTEIPIFSTENTLAAHQGYMLYMQNVLTPQELEHLEDYYKMIILLESMHYLTQFLLGNKKVKVVYYTQNLKKAINQMMLHQTLTQELYS